MDYVDDVEKVKHTLLKAVEPRHWSQASCLMQFSLFPKNMLEMQYSNLLQNLFT